MVNPKMDIDGSKYWYNEKEEYHREDGPAVILFNRSKYWYINGKQHREDGPAIELSNGDKIWYMNGVQHRLDGPAIEWGDGIKFWYYRGKFIHCSTQEEFEKIIKLIVFW